MIFSRGMVQRIGQMALISWGNIPKGRNMGTGHIFGEVKEIVTKVSGKKISFMDSELTSGQMVVISKAIGDRI